MIRGYNMQNPDWPAIIPLNQTYGPEFPVDALPMPYRNYAKSIAKAYQVPVDLPALLMLTSTAVPLAKRIQIKAGPEWIEAMRRMRKAQHPIHSPEDRGGCQ